MTLGAPSSRAKSLYPIARWPWKITDLLPGHLHSWIYNSYHSCKQSHLKDDNSDPLLLCSSSQLELS